MAYRNQNYMTNRKIKEEVDKNQKNYVAPTEEIPKDPETPTDPETPKDPETPTDPIDTTIVGAGESMEEGDGDNLDDDDGPTISGSGESMIEEEGEL